MITGKRTGAGETAVANVGSQGVFSQGGEARLSITAYFFEPTNPGQKAPYCGSVGRDWFRENHPGLKLFELKLLFTFPSTGAPVSRQWRSAGAGKGALCQPTFKCSV